MLSPLCINNCVALLIVPPAFAPKVVFNSGFPNLPNTAPPTKMVAINNACTAPNPKFNATIFATFLKSLGSGERTTSLLNPNAPK